MAVGGDWRVLAGKVRRQKEKSQKWAAAARRSYNGRRASRRAHKVSVGGAAAQAGCEHAVDAPVRRQGPPRVVRVRRVQKIGACGAVEKRRSRFGRDALRGV